MLRLDEHFKAKKGERAASSIFWFSGTCTGKDCGAIEWALTCSEHFFIHLCGGEAPIIFYEGLNIPRDVYDLSRKHKVKLFRLACSLLIMTRRVLEELMVYKCAFVYHLWAKVEHIYWSKLDRKHLQWFCIQEPLTVGDNWLSYSGPCDKENQQILQKLAN